MTRTVILLRAFLFRQLTTFGFFLFNLVNRCRRPTYSRWIDSTLPSAPGKKTIKLDIWDNATSSPSDSPLQRPCVICLHAGGFVMGEATDDTYWMNHVQDQLGALVIGVNYRLAPHHPFPTAVEDVVDALLWISDQAASLGIDTSKTIITGFSAGGNLAFTSLYLLHQLANDPRAREFKLDIRGIVLFYPVLDYSIPRSQQIASSPRPDLCLPQYIIDLCDESYLVPGVDRKDPRLSPAQAPDDFLRSLPGVHLCLAEYDMLSREGLNFYERLKKLRPDLDLGCRVVKGLQHAFDKPPAMKPREEVGVEYAAALDAIKRWLS